MFIMKRWGHEHTLLYRLSQSMIKQTTEFAISKITR